MEILSALLYEAGEIAEKERTGELETLEAATALWKLARRAIRRYPAEERIRWGCAFPSEPGMSLTPYPIYPDADYLVRFAFWRCVNEVTDVRAWRRFILRGRCAKKPCESVVFEGSHGPMMRGGERVYCELHTPKKPKVKR